MQHEYGLSTRTGTEAVSRLLRAATEACPRATIRSVDVVGAFDHVSRGGMLGALLDQQQSRAGQHANRKLGEGVGRAGCEGLSSGHAAESSPRVRSLWPDCFTQDPDPGILQWHGSPGDHSGKDAGSIYSI